MRCRLQNSGFTLIELVIVILILGIIATVAMREMGPSIETAKCEQTKAELDQLAWAIAGNPSLYSSNSRSDFGYVGDVGSLPPSLDALVQNPGGYATWDGPYVDRGMSGDDFKRDAWQALYMYTGTVIRSTGSGGDIEKIIVRDRSLLLSNTISGIFRNADGTPPGNDYRDSILVQLVYPDGSGSMTIASINPTPVGNFSFAGIPVGNHALRMIYLPDSDTMSYSVAVLPGKTAVLNLVSPADLW